MNLAAKASRGYAMAALLVAMSVMAVLLSAALPSWSHMVRREKEEELIFRGNQYARAINLYQRKFANASPQNLDILIEERMLRKKFKDPMATDKDGEFQLLYLSNEAQGASGSGPGSGGPRGSGPGAGGTRAGGAASGGAAATGGAAGPPGASYGTKPTGGIVGVASKNTGESIRVYKGRNRYSDWQFIGMEQSIKAGSGAELGNDDDEGRGAGPMGGRGRGGSGRFGERGLGPRGGGPGRP
jgi:type II secretory pathway pseudopilin PulG